MERKDSVLINNPHKKLKILNKECKNVKYYTYIIEAKVQYSTLGNTL